MRNMMRISLLCLTTLAFTFGDAPARSFRQPTKLFPLDSLDGLQTVNTKAEIVRYRGRKAPHLSPPPSPEQDHGSMLALMLGSDFKDGTIEVDVAGLPTDLSVWRSTPKITACGSKTSISGQPTDAPMINSVAITRCNTNHFPIFRGIACAKNPPASTSPMSMLSPARGPR